MDFEQWRDEQEQWMANFKKRMDAYEKETPRLPLTPTLRKRTAQAVWYQRHKEEKKEKSRQYRLLKKAALPFASIIVPDATETP